MSQMISVLDLTEQATAAVTAERFVQSGQHAAAAGRALGVSRADAAIGQHIPVTVLGTAVVSAAAAIAKDALLEVAANGQAITRAVAPATPGVAVARALQAAAAPGDRIEVLLIQN